MRSNRDFELTISTPDLQDDVIVRPPFRVSFSVDKSIYGGLNKAQIKIYNLYEAVRSALEKDAEQVNRIIEVSLRVGYKGRLEQIYSGRVHIGRTQSEKPDIVSELESMDGLQAIYGFTSLTVDGGDVIAAIIGDTEGLAQGKITNLPKLIRPKVLVGNTIDLIMEQLNRINAQWYFDDSQLNIITENEVTRDFIPVVSSDTGLIGTPTRENQMVTFTTLMNPSVRIGSLVQLVSEISERYNGIYKCETINYSGDNYGNTWQQTVTGRLSNEYTVL